MKWIYDERTPYSRLMVGIDRYGITIREWSDETPEGSDYPYHVCDGWFSWDSFKARERCYSGDNGSGKMKQRIVAGAISLMAYYGPNTCGEVSSLREYMNGGHVFTC